MATNHNKPCFFRSHSRSPRTFVFVTLCRRNVSISPRSAPCYVYKTVITICNTYEKRVKVKKQRKIVRRKPRMKSTGKTEGKKEGLIACMKNNTNEKASMRIERRNGI